jgi:hypothetical protein
VCAFSTNLRLKSIARPPTQRQSKEKNILGKKEGTKNGSQKKEKRVHVKNGEFFGA